MFYFSTLSGSTKRNFILWSRKGVTLYVNCFCGIQSSLCKSYDCIVHDMQMKVIHYIKKLHFMFIEIQYQTVSKPHLLSHLSQVFVMRVTSLLCVVGDGSRE